MLSGSLNASILLAAFVIRNAFPSHFRVFVTNGFRPCLPKMRSSTTTWTLFPSPLLVYVPAYSHLPRL